jgi:hypothetical protein
MFTKSELQSIDTEYFNVLQLSCYAAYIQSKSTGHYWGIISEEFKSFKHCKIYHKHHYCNPYHEHRNSRNLKSAIADIMSHDAFVVNGRQPIKAM